jgi:peroxiredoxin
MTLGRAGPAFASGLEPGQPLPDFTLPDHTGQRVNFAQARDGRRALVHFFRSTVW